MATPTTLPSSFVSGAILTADQMNNLRGAFRVLQIVTGTTTTTIGNSTTTYADTTLTASITPQSSSSKILVLVNQNGTGKTATNAGSAIQLRLVRGATTVVVFEALGGYTGTAISFVGSFGTVFLDSPATTSATTYKTQFRNVGNVSAVECQNGGAGETTTSTICLMEISA